MIKYKTRKYIQSWNFPGLVERFCFSSYHLQAKGMGSTWESQRLERPRGPSWGEAAGKGVTQQRWCCGEKKQRRVNPQTSSQCRVNQGKTEQCSGLICGRTTAMGLSVPSRKMPANYYDIFSENITAEKDGDRSAPTALRAGPDPWPVPGRSYRRHHHRTPALTLASTSSQMANIGNFYRQSQIFCPKPPQFLRWLRCRSCSCGGDFTLTLPFSQTQTAPTVGSSQPRRSSRCTAGHVSNGKSNIKQDFSFHNGFSLNAPCSYARN